MFPSIVNIQSSMVGNDQRQISVVMELPTPGRSSEGLQILIEGILTIVTTTEYVFYFNDLCKGIVSILPL